MHIVREPAGVGGRLISDEAEFDSQTDNHFKFGNTKKQGNWGLGQAIAYFTRIGASVSIPLTDSQEYDLIVDIENKLVRIQVKSSTNLAPSGNGYGFELRSRVKDSKRAQLRRHVIDSECDFLFAVCPIGTFLIPKEDLRGSLLVGINTDWYKYKVNC